MPTAKLEIAFGCEANHNPDDGPYPYGVGTLAASVGAITPALPAGTRAGDLLVLFLETQAQAITVSGWTQAANSPQSEAGSATRLTVFWKRASSSETAPTTSDSGDHQIGRIVGVRGAVLTGDPWNVTAGATEATVDSTGSIPGGTTTVNSCLILAACTTTLDADSTSEFSGWTNANLTGLVEIVDNVSSQGLGGGLGIASGVKTTAGSYGTTTVNYGTASGKALWSGAIKPAWIDVTSRMRSLNTRRGRQRDLDRIEAGEMGLVLNNRDRALEPEYAASPYYPYVTAMQWIRLSVDGTRVFTGYAYQWEPSYPANGKDAIVTVSCVDGFRVFANARLTATRWEREIKALAPRFWFRLGDPIDTTQPLDSGLYAIPASTGGQPQFGQTGLLLSEDTGVSFPDPADRIVVSPGSAGTLTPGSNAWQILFLMQRPSATDLPASANYEFIYYANNGTGNTVIAVGFVSADAGRLTFSVYVDGNTKSITMPAGTSLWDNHRHVVRCRRSGSTIQIWVDGQLSVEDTNFFTATIPTDIRFGYIGWYPFAATTSQYKGVLQDLVFIDDASGDPVEQAGWALHPHQGVTVDEALTDALDEIGWPSSLRGILSTDNELSDHAPGRVTMLDYAQRLMETEEGMFFMQINNAATLYGRDTLVTTLITPELTFGDGGGSEIPYTDLVLLHDDANLYNEARVSREGSSEYVLQDQTSINTYQTHTFSRSGLLHSSEDEVRQHANWIVNRLADPALEVRSITLAPSKSLAVEAAALDLELGDLVTVRFRPPGGGAMYEKQHRVQSITHSADKHLSTWRTTLGFSLYDPARDQPAIWDNATLGVWDSSTWGF